MYLFSVSTYSLRMYLFHFLLLKVGTTFCDSFDFKQFQWLVKTPFLSIFIYQISNDVTLLVWQILPRTIAALLTWRFLEWFFFFFTKITLLSLLHSIRNAFSIPECAPGKRSRPIFWWKILWKCMSASKFLWCTYVRNS